MSIPAAAISKSFGDFRALSDVTVTISPRKLTALLGPSGGGKPVTDLTFTASAPGGLALTWSEVIISDAPTVLGLLGLLQVRNALTR